MITVILVPQQPPGVNASPASATESHVIEQLASALIVGEIPKVGIVKNVNLSISEIPLLPIVNLASAIL